MVELNWMGLVCQRQQDAVDTSMGRIVAYSRRSSAQFTTHIVHGHELVYR